MLCAQILFCNIFTDYKRNIKRVKQKNSNNGQLKSKKYIIQFQISLTKQSSDS